MPEYTEVYYADATSLSELERVVNNKIKAGWRLLGTVVNASNGDLTYLIQTMVR